MQLKQLIDQIKLTLELPSDYQVGIVPASDTGAFEMAMWNFLGPLPVDVLYWESFGKDWVNDIVEQLKIQNCNILSAPYGQLPDLNQVRRNSDICFTWNGTTSGVKVPNSNWIPEDRQGLVLCDATSAIFAQPLDWPKLDVTTFSWQKVMGGEAGHGVIILSPKALKRLKSYVPSWPVPKIFRLKEGEKINWDLFSGKTINTPSMLCVSDALDAMDWVRTIGGIKKVEYLSNENFKVVQNWLDESHWAENSVKTSEIRSNTNVCIHIKDNAFKALDEKNQRAFFVEFSQFLEEENVAFDIIGYPAAPPGLRIYTGATVEKINLQRLLPWLDYTYQNQKFFS
tara:strand:+ start:331 stop:1353 length:1023 start_codon:yes stop_codon:yes gene_type:complete